MVVNMMFDRFKKLFGAKPLVNHSLWEVMEEMDPLLSYDRFQALELTERQRPMVRGLIDGTVKPAEFDAVREWQEQYGEDDDGIDALVFALQHVLDGTEVTYLFEYQAPVPVARFPNLRDKAALTVLFNDRESHLQITSLEDFVSANNITDYTLEALDLSQLRGRNGGHTNPGQGAASSSTTDPPSAAKVRKQSITIERKANSEGHLYEAVGVADIVSALNREGFDVTSDDVHLESPLEEHGLFKVPAQLEPNTDWKLFVWVVPSVECEESGA